MGLSTNFDSGQCLKFNVRFGWETDVLGRALISAWLGNFVNNAIAGLCATPQQSV
jgi:hypothetical protein